MKNFLSYPKKVTNITRRLSEFVNPPPVPGYQGSMPRLSDYPIARRR
jgi:hypothetical protein